MVKSACSPECDYPARVPIGPLVLKMIVGLQRVVADEMLDLKVEKDGKHRRSRVCHALLPPISFPSCTIPLGARRTV